MTPDCPMSPGEQDAPDLICRWIGCGLNFESLDELVSHLTAAHVTSQHGAFFCLWHGCSRTKGFNARYKMLIHIRTHTNERPYVCSQCDKRFSRQENLRIHARTHTGEKPYVCTVPGCGKAYSNSSDRFKHTRTHFVDKPYECRHPGCGKRYTDPSSLRKHVKIYGHYRRPEDQQPTLSMPPTSTAELLDPSMAASARLDLSPSPSSSGSSLVPSPVPSTPSPSLLPPPLFSGSSSGSIGGIGASGLSPWAPVTAAAWTVALQQYQAGFFLHGGSGLAGLGGLQSHPHMVEEEDEEEEEMEDMDTATALDLSMCPSPLDLSLPSSRAKHQ
ncbi:zinc finger protein GLIS2-like isoform X2 [Palaemon carinicauda]|uniref:zinc finger protein GLIS2-like isoform X1 n=1 Tax=Palaemon carinicauda TaxID=392227 RepID=UPI0035B5C612